MKYDDACKMMGFDISAVCPITPKLIFFAYKEGVVKEYATKKEAESFSNNIEKVVINKKEIQAWHDDRKDTEEKVYRCWISLLQQNYIDSNFIKEVFDICFEEASEHACGFYEIESYMQEYYNFVYKVRKVKI